ncbi:MAG: hypothetical protein LAT78_13540 [Roseinatronobacter sp.]|nr:hypothetical protein [Roseinatronobacter sp.]
MTELSETRLQEIAKQALEAAQLATEAAQEAEAAIGARNEGALALGKVAQQGRWLAMAAAGASVLVLALGAAFWMRGASHLREVASVQATAAAGFIESLMQMNGALNDMKAVLGEVQAQADHREGAFDVLIARLDQRLEEIVIEAAARSEDGEAQQSQLPDLLVALAEVELNLTRQLADLGRIAPQATLLPQTASAPAQVAPAPAAAAPARAAARPAARPAAAPQPNPFRFP